MKAPLIGADGRQRFGIYNAPLTFLTLEDFRPYGAKDGSSAAKNWILKYRIKRWQYLVVCNNDMIFGIAVVRLVYMCNLFACPHTMERELDNPKIMTIIAPHKLLICAYI